MTEPISNETRQSILRIARRLQNLREKEENRITIDGAIVETYLRAEREVLLELASEWQPALGLGEPDAPVQPFIGVDPANDTTELAPMSTVRASRIFPEDVAHYIMDRDGSVAVEYIVRDLFANHKNARNNAMSILKRLESIGDVKIDYGGDGQLIATLRRWPKKED